MAFLVHAINQGFRGVFIDFSDLLDRLYQSQGDCSESKLMTSGRGRDVADEIAYLHELRLERPEHSEMLRDEPDDLRRRSTVREYLQARSLQELQDNGVFAEWASWAGRCCVSFSHFHTVRRTSISLSLPPEEAQGSEISLGVLEPIFNAKLTSVESHMNPTRTTLI